MIYFDNAATSFQKPKAVYKAVESALITAANPGRGGYAPSMKAAEIVYACREEAAALFHLPEPEQVVFTSNATHALNLAIKGAMLDGGHMVISGYEHNSVCRPAEALRENGIISFSIADSPLFQSGKLIESLKEAVRGDTKYVVVTHVSNVFGYVLPIYEIDAFCARNKIGLIIDAAQSAGVLKIDARKLTACDYICMPGHKSLYGPQGTGMLLSLRKKNHRTLIEGGTGSVSNEIRQPLFLPDRFESGTLNVPGISGLSAGLRFINDIGTEEVLSHEEALRKRAAEGLSVIYGIETFLSPIKELQTGVLSFRSRSTSEEVAQALADENICVRAGLHCSPLAHKNAGTYETGTVRISFSYFNTEKEVDAFLSILNRFQTQKKN